MEAITLLFQVTQQLYCEGEFGDLEQAGTNFIGIYSSRYLAEKAVATVSVVMFHAQFGGSVNQTCLITEVELDKITEHEPAGTCKACGCNTYEHNGYCDEECWNSKHGI